MILSRLSSSIERWLNHNKRRDRTKRSGSNHPAVADFPSRAPPDSKLPPELTDHIIDYLYYDLATLKSCSLVCSSWLSASRHHLWSDSHVSMEFCPPRDDLEAFLKKSPHIACSIKSLHIRFSSPDSKRCVKDETRWMNETLLPIVRSMNDLQAFYLSGRVGAHMANFFNPISIQFSSIVSLDFTRCEFETFPLFSDFVWSFPKLNNLSIHQLGFSTELNTGMLTIRDASLPRPPLERMQLHLEETSYDVVLLVTTWMVGNGLASRLNDIGITQDSPSASGLRLFVHMVGSKLKTLTIECKRPLPFPLPNFSIFTPITHCTNLDTLVISSVNLEWLLHVANYITSSHITTITLKITSLWPAPEFDEALADFDWETFCETFEVARFSHTEVFLEVSMGTAEWRERAQALITQRVRANPRVCVRVKDCVRLR